MKERAVRYATLFVLGWLLIVVSYPLGGQGRQREPRSTREATTTQPSAVADHPEGIGIGPAAVSVNPGGVVNAASFAKGAPVAPGSIVSVFGANLATGTASATALPLPTSLASSSMQFGSQSAVPLFFVSPGQANVQVPWELAGSTLVTVTATAAGATSTPVTVQLVPAAPGIFTLNQQGTGPGAILDAQNRLVNASNPATPGSFLQIFATGLGAVVNPPKSGTAAGSTSTVITTPSVTLGNGLVPVLFAGLAPGFVGLYQVNVQVPTSALIAASVPIQLSTNGVHSNVATIPIVSAGGLNLGSQGFSALANLTLGTTVKLQIQAVASGSGYTIFVDDELSPTSPVQFLASFDATGTANGTTVTFKGATSSSIYLDLSNPFNPVTADITSVTLTMTFASIPPPSGSTVSGTLTLVTTAGTFQGPFTGTLTGIK